MDIALLEGFPKTEWDEEPTEGWLALCAQLKEYEPPQRTLTIGRKERKWELVSAYQKSMRRGDRELAMRLVSAMDSMSEEWGYFHRRVATTFCEDIGLADQTLVLFAIAAMKVYTPKKLGMANYRLICFLTEKACALAMRSRVYCSYSIIEGKLKGLNMMQVSEEEHHLLGWLDWVDGCRDGVISRKEAWCLRNNYRGEGMLKFAGAEHEHLQLEIRGAQGWPPVHDYYGLPGYAYDMHTRVGLICLAKLAKLIPTPPCSVAPQKLLGWHLFFQEGGLIQGELIDTRLVALEQKIVAAALGVSMECWIDIGQKVAKALHDGTMHEIRTKIAWSFYGRLQPQVPTGIVRPANGCTAEEG